MFFSLVLMQTTVKFIVTGPIGIHHVLHTWRVNKHESKDVYHSQRGIYTLGKLTLHYSLIKPIVASSQKTPCLVIFPCPPFKCAGFYSL